MRNLKIHGKVRDLIRTFAKPIKKDVGELLLKLQLGISLGMPESRSMPSIYQGAYELRLKDAAGIYKEML
jgi:hypothetical protein